MKVFLSHTSADKPAVKALGETLAAHGIEPWVDEWEIAAGDDIVASINDGLERADAGIVVFSRHTRKSRWVEAEVSYLTYSRITEGKRLIPVVVGDDAWVPPLLRPLARRGIDEVQAIVDALYGRSAKPTVRAELGGAKRIEITLRPAGEAGAKVCVTVDGVVHGEATVVSLPTVLREAHERFLEGFRRVNVRSPEVAERSALEGNLTALGRALGTLCLPGDASEAVAQALDGCPIGERVEVVFEAEGAAWLGLPFEALRLPDDRVLATHPNAVVSRRPRGLAARDRKALAGPLKILVAVGAPDEGTTRSTVLDSERELQAILDAVAPMARHENAAVRILEVGHPEQIGAAIKVDAYHVLHISCHGGPGTLELEDEEGRAVEVDAETLIGPLRKAGRPLPLVLLNTCKGAVHTGDTASLAEALLRAGVPAVVAMQTVVSDRYATLLARAFYGHLAAGERLRASHALAAARLDLEKARREAIGRGGSLAETLPEHATAALFVAGEERPLADFGLDKVPLEVTPVYQVAGPVPQLRIDDLIGRREPLRGCLRTLRDPASPHAGVLLTGIGGVGKSAVAGRAMQRLREDGWVVPAHAGRFDLGAVAVAVGAALLERDDAAVQKLGALLTRADLQDAARMSLVSKALAELPVLLVLDDFEQNLAVGGGAFLDADLPATLVTLAGQARAGRLLLTCRHPLPVADGDGGELAGCLHQIALGPLSDAETRKLLLRLPSLEKAKAAEVRTVLHLIGGHPRMLELLDAVLRGGEGRLAHVTKKLRNLLVEHEAAGGSIALPEAASDAETAPITDGIQAVLALGARDIVLQTLLDLARGHVADEVLLQLAVSNLPVSPAGLARMLLDDPADPENERDEAAAEAALGHLCDLSLVHRFPDGDAWVHRWTAEGLASLDAGQAGRCVRAGLYRWWRVANETHHMDDAVEALRNHLAGEDFDRAVAVANASFDAYQRFNQSVGIAALASEVLETLPEDHASFAVVADQEAKAHLALGRTESAQRRYRALLQRYERLASSEPDRTDYQRDLSVSFDRMGDLYRALGEGESARQAYERSLGIRERLASSEPDRTDYQRDLSVSFNKMGDLYRALGEGESARQAYERSLGIAERLASSEPDRTDYQRDLSVSFDRMGDLYRALGEGESARQAYERSLGIRERLASSEPDRTDYQRDLSVSYNNMGQLRLELGDREGAAEMLSKDLAIAERLAALEPRPPTISAIS